MKRFILAVFAAALSFQSHADITEGSCASAQTAKVVTKHTAQIGGKLISYTATAGFIEILAADKKSKACVFYTAYDVQPEVGATRPVTFAFNGGPGSSSVWLHLGLMGPKRVDMGADGLNPPRSPALIANEFSLLDVSDVVMIDPVATGFSHTVGDSQPDKFFGVENDYKAVAEFVRNYLNTYNRWQSPKFILGESYGGIRGTYLADYLQSSMHIRVDGLILVSPALSNTTFFGDRDNLIPYITYFPSFAATAWFHRKIAAKYQGLTVEEVFSEAKKFADTRLKDALFAGSVLAEQEREEVAEGIAEFIGTTKVQVLARDLRIDDDFFYNGFLADRHMTTGRFDSRFARTVPSQQLHSDPSAEIGGFAYTAGINDYLRTDLGVHTTAPYNISGDISSWPSGRNGKWGVMPLMANALSANPNFGVFIASGYYDFACPSEGSAYEVRQMAGSRTLKARIHHLNYDGGHMMYTNPEALKKLKGDLSQFIENQKMMARKTSPFLVGPR